MSHVATPRRGGISRIPPEILRDIFFHCLLDNSISQNDPPILLSSVCGLWRALALATPALWASFDISYNKGAPHPPLSDIRTRLQRSGTHPLSFTLNGVGPWDKTPNLSTVLTTLTAARQRWHKVVITVHRIPQEILDLITLGDTPLLQSIRCYATLPQRIPLHMLDHCPRLESFRWSSIGSSLLLPLGNTQLTSLYLQAWLSVSECIILLRLSPRLSSATFRGLSSSDPSPSPAPRLTHLTLCTLAAMGAQSDTLLAALTLPALLDLELTVGHAEWDIGLTAFLARSNPTLHQLSLQTTQMRVIEPALLRILALVPHLRSLILSTPHPESPPFTATLIRALHPPPPPGTPLCPRLQRLELSQIGGCPDGLCAAMLRARWGAQADANEVACLERVSLGLWGGVHHCDLEDMMKLRAEGMEELFWEER